MDQSFWHQRWADNEIGFHQMDTNPLLVRHLSALSLAPEARVFVPLCGKSLDMLWLLAQGLRVVGIELSDVAVKQFFQEQNIEPTLTKQGALMCYYAQGIEIFVGDVFALTADLLGPVDAIYDRAALVALPLAMRKAYTKHLLEVSKVAPQLLITFFYDQALLSGPPFAISAEEVQQHYGDHYQVSLLESLDVEKLKGQLRAQEQIWLLKASCY